MILKPSNISPDNLTFPSNEPIDITWKNNGDLQNAFQVIIKRIDTGSAVFDSGKITSFSSKYTVPADSIASNMEYTFTIKVFNSNNDSSESNPVVLRLSARPVIKIPNDGYMRNQLASFQATYSHSESRSLKAYEFILYDEFDKVLEQSGYLYDGLLEYTFKHLLIDDTKYKVECVAISQLDVVGTSGKITFTADYIPPTVFFQLGANTFIDKPFVRLTWTTVRIIGKTSGIVSFVDNKKINVIDGVVYFDEGFLLNGDFTLKLWAEQFKIDKDIVTLVGDNGSLTIKIYSGRVHVFKKVGGITLHYAAQIVGDYDKKQLYINVQQIKNHIQLYCEVMP
ncbi:hypothetical protein [Paenibacillus chitinolyticus]|uniref:hypothetical protein n=1 Tax=Paenibacillus chitinolyticus TaxID=79263 RepID=UPI003D0774D8